jgi:hypothetical protein
MRKIITSLLVLSTMLACNKKNSAIVEETRLVKIKSTDAASTDVFYFSFDYNTAGKITKISTSVNDNAPETYAVITYTGSEIIITSPSISNTALDAAAEIRYTVDAAGKPLKRISYERYQYKAPVNLPQITVITDTALYTYDNFGLLAKITGSNLDTTWFNPGTVQTANLYSLYTADYTNADNNLTQIAKTTNTAGRYKQNAGVFTTTRRTEELYKYSYTNGYNNLVDFTNAVILSELDALFNTEYTLNKTYKNIPDKITYTMVTRDLVNGTIISSDNNTQNAVITFNDRGIISFVNLNSGTGKSTKEFIYSR